MTVPVGAGAVFNFILIFSALFEFVEYSLLELANLQALYHQDQQLFLEPFDQRLNEFSFPVIFSLLNLASV